MSKRLATILSVFLLSAAILPTAAALDGQKTVALADVSTTATTEMENGLLVPQTYEQYLPLQNPTSVAVCENYTAIADGNSIYLYDRDDNEYRKYLHTVNAEASQNNILKLQFDDDENLYFLDGAYLYLLETDKFNAFETQTATTDCFPCDNFLIEGDTLFYVEAKTPAKILQTELANPDVSTATDVATVNGKPTLAVWNDELYFTDESTTVILYKINPETLGVPTQVATLSTRVEHITIADGILAYTTPSGELFAYPVTNISQDGKLTQTEAEGYTHLATFDGNVYVTQNTGAIHQYSTAMKDFTEFIICANANEPNRLSAAVAQTLHDGILYIADNGNHRISVYDTAANAFVKHVNTTLSPSFLSTDGKTLLCASQSKAAVYTLDGDETDAEIKAFDNFQGNVTGVASVYGKHYLVTDSNHFYALIQDENGDWTATEVKKTSTRYPDLLTADVYGNLYIQHGKYLYRFTEAQFMHPDEAGTELYDGMPTNASKIAADYDCNVYALADNAVYKYEKQTDGSFAQSIIDTSEQFVYGEAPTLSSFTFGIEENAAYLLCDGNYIVQTKNFNLPTVKNIPVNGVDEVIFDQAAEAQFQVVKTAPYALLVQFDIDLLQGADVFPYLSYERSEAEKTALKIGETDKYFLIAYFDKQTSKYYTYLVLKDFCETLNAEDYRTQYAPSEYKSAWITNVLALYKFPYLCDKLTVVSELKRGQQVTLIGEIGELDHQYYHILYVDENGVEKTGYIPQSYATLFDASPEESEHSGVGSEQSDSDRVWRMAYIILGTAVIGILIDYLLLRKKNKD